MRKIIMKVSENVVFWLSVVLMGFLTVVSLISTTYFKISGLYPERPSFKLDNVFLNVIFICLFAAVIYFFCKIKTFEKIRTQRLACAAAALTVVLGIIWINMSGAYPGSDQSYVSYVAYQASQGIFKQFEAGKYIQTYPNQLGMVALLELIYRVTGGENWVVYQYITAAADGFTVYFLYKITHRLFNNKKTDLIVLFLSVVCAQLIFYTTYVYGITLGLCLALVSFYFMLLFFDGGKIRYAVLSGLLIGLSIIIKNNYSIFLVAEVILAVYEAVGKKRLKNLTAAAAGVILTIVLSMSLTYVYEVRSGEDIGSGMPKILWVAMGMQEGERAEGWYNEFNYETYMESGSDAEVSTQAAAAAIEERLSDFAEDPLYALRFYYKKIVSQWNEATYESIWANQFHYVGSSKIIQSIYDGKLYTLLLEYMNIYQLLIFAAMLFWLVSEIRREKTLERLFLPMVVIGGFIFHIIWEAKSGYIFPYFMCMLPFAAAGLSEGYRVFTVKAASVKRTRTAAGGGDGK